MSDATAYHWLDSQAALVEQCRHWNQLPLIGIDTEFVRTRTYHARLGLIQVHAAGSNWLIDPLAAGDLAPLHDLLCNPTVTKIIHSGSEDIEIFHRLGSANLAGFFDTQIAAALCGLGSSLSYQALVRDLTGIEVDKDQTRSDWLKRPLTESQKRYATLDVEHLPQIHEDLARRLSDQGRTDWLSEDCAMLTARTCAADQLDEQYRKFKLAWQLDGPQRATLRALLEWREHTARHRDRPRKHVLSDNDLLAMARLRPADEGTLLDLELEQPRAVARFATALLGIIAAAPQSGQFPPAPPEPLDRETKRTVRALREKVQETADVLDIAPEFLCGRREVMYFLQYGKPSARLSGWRMEQLDKLFEPHRFAQPEEPVT